MKKTLGILGNDYQKTTKLVEEIILNTKAKTDQEHIKMNIIINNKLLLKDNLTILNIIHDLEKIESDYLILAFDNQDIKDFIEDNTNLIILKNEDLVKQVLLLHEENILWKE